MNAITAVTRRISKTTLQFARKAAFTLEHGPTALKLMARLQKCGPETVHYEFESTPAWKGARFNLGFFRYCSRQVANLPKSFAYLERIAPLVRERSTSSNYYHPISDFDLYRLLRFRLELNEGLHCFAGVDERYARIALEWTEDSGVLDAPLPYIYEFLIFLNADEVHSNEFLNERYLEPAFRIRHVEKCRALVSDEFEFDTEILPPLQSQVAYELSFLFGNDRDAYWKAAFKFPMELVEAFEVVPENPRIWDEKAAETFEKRILHALSDSFDGQRVSREVDGKLLANMLFAEATCGARAAAALSFFIHGNLDRVPAKYKQAFASVLSDLNGPQLLLYAYANSAQINWRENSEGLALRRYLAYLTAR